MADDALAQVEADALLKMEKVPASSDVFHFPDLGGRIEVPLVSRDHREAFSLDINRKRIALTTAIRLVPERLLFSPASTSQRRTVTLTGPTSAFRTCIFTARAMATSGRWRSLLVC